MSDMSRTEAIEILNDLAGYEKTIDLIQNYSVSVQDALHIAIASLETDEAYQLEYERTTKNDLGVDCISRAEAVRVASGYCHPSNIAKELKKLPSVLPKTVNIHYPPESESAYEKALLKAYADGQASVESVLEDIKADMVAMLTDIQSEIRHFMYDVNPSSSESDYACNYMIDIIQQKINSLKAESEDSNA